MNIGNCTKKSDMFKLEFEQKIKSHINNEIKNGKNKVILTQDYITEKLDIYYNIDNLYIKMRNMLIGTNLGVSIKRKSREFVFYELLDGVNRESDLFKFTVIKKLIPLLLEEFEIKYEVNKYKVGLEENYLKELLDVNFSTTNLYKTLKKTLPNNIILFTENKVIDEKMIKAFVFYDINKKVKIDRQVEEEKYRIREEEMKKEKEIEDIIRNENQKIKDSINQNINDTKFTCPNCNNLVSNNVNKCDLCGQELEW